MKKSFKIFIAALWVIYQRLRPIIKAVLFPILTLIVLRALEDSIERKSDELPTLITNILPFIFLVAHYVLYTYIAVSIHRIIILGALSVPSWGIKGWSSRETNFFLYVLGLFILATVVFFIGTLLPLWIGVIFAVLTYIILSARISLVLPASSIEKNITFAQSWKLTKNNTLFITMAMYLWTLAITAPVVLILTLVINTLGESLWAAFANLVVIEFYRVLCMIVMISSLSISYLHIINNKKQKNSPNDRL